MISELKKSEFYKCNDLLYEQGQLEAKAVVQGINPGRIFVDDTNAPTSGLIWLGNNDGFIFIGNENNEGFNIELNHFINTVISPEARKVGLTWFEGLANHNNWNETIENVFKDRNLGSWKQRVYTLHKNDYKGNSLPIDAEYSVVKIGETLLENSDHSILNMEFLHSKIVDSWTSPERFLENGIGYCVVFQNKIVSICFSGFVADHVHCIDIETLEEHQGKKLGQKVAQTFVKECLDNNLVPYWDCMDSNKPSIAVAENLGFRKLFNYIGYEFEF